MQKNAIDCAKFLIHEAISKTMELEKLCTKTFCIADLGCGVGPNAIVAVEEIIESVEKSILSTIPEFHVFFNDIPTNDFNTLFEYLPINRKYYAAGVPGSFYGRLFPSGSIHFAHSSFSLQWLSRVPQEVMDVGSSSWNKGNIYYSHVKDDVARAYAKQFAQDLDCFLECRAQEVVHGGLVAIIIPARSNGVSHSQVSFNMNYNFLGSCLMDLADKGLVQEEQIDSFNVPVFHPSLEEMEYIVQRNGHFTIERNEHLPWNPLSSGTGNQPPQVQISKCVRAIMEGRIAAHFGHQIMDQLFDLYTKKLHQEYATIAASDVLVGFILLKRKSMD